MSAMASARMDDASSPLHTFNECIGLIQIAVSCFCINSVSDSSSVWMARLRGFGIQDERFKLLINPCGEFFTEALDVVLKDLSHLTLIFFEGVSKCIGNSASVI